MAARGIDVDELELVVNYDLPYDAEDYVHRIGRTGRAGREGMAVTFVSGREIYKLQFIERFTRTKIRRGVIPSHSEVEERRADMLIERVREAITAGKFDRGASMAERLIEEGFSSTDVAAAAIQLLAGGTAETPSEPAVPAPARPPKPERVSLRPPSRGMQWVSVDVGRESRVGPREIVSLLEEILGLPGRTVGIIEISSGQSFAQVPRQFLDILRAGPRRTDTSGGSVEIALVGKPGDDSPAGGNRRKAGHSKRPDPRGEKGGLGFKRRK